ncbi:conserved hypothetical protein [Flavobacterium sp. 9AF]|uniref:DM13 domain-containing protein n=1 Tax=Flavobacterium sp. 9AF TaxID=2653142 RepID=UPI0012F4038D|nr:DM13 domain-containing protein [Flavobacterium sp. 9AF]VXB90380.1 conserved hypothetical protein [Flavobacterium sp. 9AF]
MFQKIILVIAIFFTLSCSKDDTPSTTNNNNADLFATGEFVPTSGITVTGKATIYKNATQKYVALENFSISSGPDLKVYLSTTVSPDTFINLGDLTTATTYAIPQATDLEIYKYVLIHCQTHNHLYAVASLNTF